MGRDLAREERRAGAGGALLATLGLQDVMIPQLPHHDPGAGPRGQRDIVRRPLELALIWTDAVTWVGERHLYQAPV